MNAVSHRLHTGGNRTLDTAPAKKDKPLVTEDKATSVPRIFLGTWIQLCALLRLYYGSPHFPGHVTGRVIPV
ncbi:MAG: hypothetical protein NTW27_05340 [Deltaproteobacteria bacterium]|nr:hypothetical protein [Deltaproteobacteria bacterium]